MLEAVVAVFGGLSRGLVVIAQAGIRQIAGRVGQVAGRIDSHFNPYRE